jgi:hypothetical protein
MEPQDDPEKRIRDLERPLADTARASELGEPARGGLGYPPPPPGPVPPAPPPYNAPPAYDAPPAYSYAGPYGTPPKSSGGNRLWWILGAVIVVAVLALAGGIAAFAGHQFSRVRSIIASTPTSTVRVTNAPGTTPRGPNASASGTPTPVPQWGGQLTVSGINENRTVACNDSTVTVSGISNTVVLTGHCASLTVSGMKNVVTVDAVDNIDASGLDNQVTFHSGSPQISNSGSENTVQQG